MSRRRPPVASPGPLLMGVHVVGDRIPESAAFPFDLPFVPGLDLDLDRPVTFLVGENGSGKSTLLEAIAELTGLPAGGGSRNEAGVLAAEDGPTRLADVLRPRFRCRPPDAFFFRAETLVNFATWVRDVGAKRYGDGDLHARSHGEAFLQVIEHRLGAGLFLMDEPEAALSPQRQLRLLRLMWLLVEGGRTQLIIATHSPILLTFPGAGIVSFDDPTLPLVRAEDTSHHEITRGMLEHPDRYWRHLSAPEEGD